MKKIILLFCFFSCYFHLTYAQDTIIMKTLEVIPAKVTKVGKSEIEYKRITNIDGPDYTLKINKVVGILYQNRQKDIFDTYSMNLYSANKYKKNKPVKDTTEIRNEKPKINKDSIEIIKIEQEQMEFQKKNKKLAQENKKLIEDQKKKDSLKQETQKKQDSLQKVSNIKYENKSKDVLPVNHSAVYTNKEEPVAINKKDSITKPENKSAPKDTLISQPQLIKQSNNISTEDTSTQQINHDKNISYDIILLKNADEIKSKVFEVTATEVKYKKYDNLKGPTYIVLKSDIFMIKYSNGNKDIFK